MKTRYLEIVTPDVDAACTIYEKALGVKFGEPVAELGNARTAKMADGGMAGIRAPMREDEEPVVRPYWLVEDIEKAVEEAEAAGAQIAMGATTVPGVGTFAIFLHGGNQHGLWQK